MTTDHEACIGLVDQIKEDCEVSTTQMGKILCGAGGPLGYFGLRKLSCLTKISKESTDVVLSLLNFSKLINDVKKSRGLPLILIGCDKQEFEDIKTRSAYLNISMSSKLESDNATLLIKQVDLTEFTKVPSCVNILSNCEASNIFTIVINSYEDAYEGLKSHMASRGLPLFKAESKDDFVNKVDMILKCLFTEETMKKPDPC